MYRLTLPVMFLMASAGCSIAPVQECPTPPEALLEKAEPLPPLEHYRDQLRSPDTPTAPPDSGN